MNGTDLGPTTLITIPEGNTPNTPMPESTSLTSSNASGWNIKYIIIGFAIAVVVLIIYGLWFKSDDKRNKVITTTITETEAEEEKKVINKEDIKRKNETTIQKAESKMETKTATSIEGDMETKPFVLVTNKNEIDTKPTITISPMTTVPVMTQVPATTSLPVPSLPVIKPVVGEIIFQIMT